MLKFGNKEFRNLQEQVKKNMDDILFILQEEGVLNEFGIKVVGQEESVIDMPTVDDYKEEHEDWSYGDAYAVGTEAPYELYILTRANGTHPNDYWFNIGEFPVPGPQGEEGPEGPQGPQGPTGPSGQDGVSPEISIGSVSATTLSASASATASVSMTGTYAQPVLNFAFGIPQGQEGSAMSTIAWGDITGSIANQTDLVSALQGKANASALSSYATLNELSSYAKVSDLSSYALQSELSLYASVSALNSAISGVESTISSLDYASVHALSEDTVIPSLSGYATESWVLSQGYASASDLSLYATQSWVSSNFLGSTALSGYATELWVESKNYASQTWVNNQISTATSDFVSAEVLSSYATVSSLSEYATVDSLSSYATQQWVGSQGYATVVQLSSAISGLDSRINTLDYASVGALSSGTYIPTISGTNDGSYWTSLTIDEDTYDIPQGGGSGDYVPVLVQESEEDPEMPQYRYAGEITNSSTSIIASVIKEEPDQVAANKSTSLELYQDDAYLSHSYQELVSKDNPDYDPEDPESSPSIEEAVDLSTNLYVGEGTITANRSLYDEGLQETVDESVDLFDLATKSELGSAINSLSSVYQPIGSYASQADIDALSSVYASIGALPNMSLYAELSASNTFTGSNFFEEYVGITGSVRVGSYGISFGPGDARIYGDYVGGVNHINTNCGLNVSGTLCLVGNGGIDMSHHGIIFNESSMPGYCPIMNVDLLDNAYEILLPYASGTIALTSDIPSISGYATESWVSSNFLSSGYVPSISGYAELSGNNVLSGDNYFQGTFEVQNNPVTLFSFYDDTDPENVIYGDANISLNYDDQDDISTLEIAVGTTVSENNISLIADNIYANGTKLVSESWTFVLSDNTSITKTIWVGE